MTICQTDSSNPYRKHICWSMWAKSMFITEIIFIENKLIVTNYNNEQFKRFTLISAAFCLAFLKFGSHPVRSSYSTSFVRASVGEDASEPNNRTSLQQPAVSFCDNLRDQEAVQ
ncbi:hypothetical protein Tcan_07057 [Toxocara canis]|uniref:Uncharacterized protein n=1 Tax=Toxocara canis TaxID=6265 RepID=A0A0B2W006_TOXCA|nr:hypothetical protein Tcan_07057 [Toxocara canis]